MLQIAVRSAMVVLVLILASGCASVGPGPSAAGDRVVWDCGWRALP